MSTPLIRLLRRGDVTVVTLDRPPANALDPALLAPVVRRLVFGAKLFDSFTAMEVDLFDELVEDDRVLDRAIEVAHEFPALPRATYEIVKKRVRAGALDRGRGQLGGADAAGQATAEAREAARKVLDSRSE